MTRRGMYAIFADPRFGLAATAVSTNAFDGSTVYYMDPANGLRSNPTSYFTCKGNLIVAWRTF